MGFQNSINGLLGTVAAGAALTKGQSNKKVSLAIEDAELAEKEFNLKNEKEEAEKALNNVQSAKELEKRKEALSVLMKKIKAVNVQRADWKRRMGGNE